MSAAPATAPPAGTPPLSAFDFAKGTPKWWTVVCIQGQTPSSAKWMCDFAEAYAEYRLASPSAPAPAPQAREEWFARLVTEAHAVFCSMQRSVHGDAADTRWMLEAQIALEGRPLPPRGLTVGELKQILAKPQAHAPSAPAGTMNTKCLQCECPWSWPGTGLCSNCSGKGGV